MRLSHLETPCLILEKGKLQQNITTMRLHLKKLNVGLRPHVKTAKCMEVIRLTLEGQPGGITVSTLKEAEYFFERGITDILYAVGIAPVKLERVAELRKKGAELTILLDTPDQVKAVAARGEEWGMIFPALIEIDCDGHRSGVQPDDRALLIEIGQLLHNHQYTELRGVMTHAGESYNCYTLDALERIATRERNVILSCAQILREAGLPCRVTSVGSTPTAFFSKDFSGISEVRAGVYMFHDLTMVGLQTCRIEDIAISVLASVIGTQKEKGWIITDAGWMALSRDVSTASQPVDQGYGLVCGIDGRVSEDLIVAETNQEHGILANRFNNPLDYDQFPMGTPLRILPNHACATASMHDRYHLVDGTTEVFEVWHRFNGW